MYREKESANEEVEKVVASMEPACLTDWLRDWLCTASLTGWQRYWLLTGIWKVPSWIEENENHDIAP